MLYGGPWPFFQTGDVKAAELYLRDFTQTYSDAGLAQSKLWSTGTLCITIAANIADTAILAIPGCFPDSVVGFIADPAKADARFIKYCIDTLKQGMQNASHGTTQDNLSVDKLLTFNFVVPPVDEQRHIASILSAYDDLIENNTRRIAILEEMARRLYEEWFVRFRFPGHEDVRMVESELGLVPEGWHVLPLGETVADIVDYRGKTPAKLGGEWECEGVPAISALNVKGGRLVNLEKSRCVNEDLYKLWMKNPLQKGDILMTSEAPLGELHLLQRSTRYCLSQRLYSIRAENKMLTPALLYLTLDSQRTQSELASRATGATVAGIRQSELRKIPILIPPREVQSAIGPLVEQLLAQRSTLDEINTNLRTTRDLLLPKLISGELDVSTLPDPETVAA